MVDLPGMNIESYYKFDSNNINPNYTNEVNKNSTYCILRQLQLQGFMLAFYTIPDYN